MFQVKKEGRHLCGTGASSDAPAAVPALRPGKTHGGADTVPRGLPKRSLPHQRHPRSVVGAQPDTSAREPAHGEAQTDANSLRQASRQVIPVSHGGHRGISLQPRPERGKAGRPPGRAPCHPDGSFAAAAHPLPAHRSLDRLARTWLCPSKGIRPLFCGG